MDYLNNYQPAYRPGEQPEFNQNNNPKKRRDLSVILLIAGVGLAVFLSFKIGGGSNQFETTNNSKSNIWQKITQAFTGNNDLIDKSYIKPIEESDRLDILVLGIRGENDPNAIAGGPLLTDTIMLFSFDKTTKKAALISIPRDLYLPIASGQTSKINAVYEYGIYHTNNSLDYMKKIISQISGVYIDKVAVIDFSSFKKLVDQIGGVDVYLDKPFSEPVQWGYPFKLPAGNNHLDGQDTLYYARSRFSSSDFDRSKRQQEIVLATKKKLSKINFWSDPINTFNIFNTIRSNIKTDISLIDIKQMLDLVNQVNSANQIKKFVISTDNVVQESRNDKNEYILLPKNNDLVQFRVFFQNILNQ